MFLSRTEFAKLSITQEKRHIPARVERSESPISDKLVAADPVLHIRELLNITCSVVFVKVLTIPGPDRSQMTYAWLVETSSP
jgi:hypothetical protein